MWLSWVCWWRPAKHPQHLCPPLHSPWLLSQRPLSCCSGWDWLVRGDPVSVRLEESDWTASESECRWVPPHGQRTRESPHAGASGKQTRYYKRHIDHTTQGRNTKQGEILHSKQGYIYITITKNVNLAERNVVWTHFLASCYDFGFWAEISKNWTLADGPIS
jgi:hypothetical protein